MIGKTISHYKIIEKLGEGGMGIVYKAYDQKLDRIVALKFLPIQTTTNEIEKARFIQEARAAASLNHPNICTIYEINEFEGQSYIAMEYIEGQTLKEKIKQEPLNINTGLGIGIQIAEGLKKAHEKNIIHRDIKSANIMINDEALVKIMDFGLAKFVGQAGLTKTQRTMGTIAYMSPEQARGESLDHRTDIWSFGVVLYEMLTGQLPFMADYEQAVIYSIMNKEAKSPSQLCSDIPRNIENVILKALEKNKEDRYKDVRELMIDLKAPSHDITAVSKKEISIIVLPFVNMSPDPEQEYFSDGLTEEIMTDLSNIQDLLVISRSSAMTFKGTNKKIVEIAREVKVQYVLEGSVRKAGNNLRITAQLIDAIKDVHLWAEKYVGTLDEVFDIQEKVSRSIANALTLKLRPEEDQKLAKRAIINVQAYEYYLRARQEIYAFSKDGLDRAIQYLQNGIDLVGENAMLYAGMGYIFAQYVNIGLEHEGYLKKAEEYAYRALTLDSESFEAHLVLGFINMLFYGIPKRSIYHFKQALLINQDDPHVLFWMTGGYGINWGKKKEAWQTYNRILQVDPFNIWRYCKPLLDIMVEGQFNHANDYLTAWFDKEPQNTYAQFFSALFLAYCGYFDEARNLVEKNVHIEMKDVCAKLALFVKLAIESDKKRINRLLTADFLKTTKRDAQNCYFVSSLFALSGMNDEAFEWLENAVNRGFINYPFINEYDPFLKNIRGEERFKKLMEKVKHEWENLEV